MVNEELHIQAFRLKIQRFWAAEVYPYLPSSELLVVGVIN